jgi:hypothetical protein
MNFVAIVKKLLVGEKILWRWWIGFIGNPIRELVSHSIFPYPEQLPVLFFLLTCKRSIIEDDAYPEGL